MSEAKILRELSARVLAEEPRRELDADVAEVIGLSEWIALKYQDWLAGDDDTPSLQAEFRRVYAPRYTTSHDAAFAAMPAGWRIWEIIHTDEGFIARFYHVDRRWPTPMPQPCPDLPRALTAAGLLARAVDAEQGETT